MKTFKVARQELFAYLRLNGWNVQTTKKGGCEELKVPYATSPDNKTQLYFKAQSVHYVWSGIGAFELGNARSIFVDIRAISPAAFLEHIEKHYSYTAQVMCSCG